MNTPWADASPRLGRPAAPASAQPVPSASRAPPAVAGFGTHLRWWRQHRRMSQLDLALTADISTRHLSCVETGRASPSREMVLRLAERLAVPLRDRNTWLVAAGFAPMYRERPLDDPALACARQAVERLLRSHEPYPAMAVDRHWNMVSANALVPPLMKLCDAALLASAPQNVLRLSLHPRGLAPHIANLTQWRAHLFGRLRQQIAATADPVLSALLDELRAYPVPADGAHDHLDGEAPGVLMPFRLRTPYGELNFISTVTVFGSPVDITLAELALETFFPADGATARALRTLATA